MALLHHNALNPWREFDRMLGTLKKAGDWGPPFDTAVTDSEYTLFGDLPGMAQKEIEIRVEDGLLTVRGERKPSAANDAVRSQRLERPRGRFSRSFRLPEDINEDKVKASYENGVLRLTLPRQAPVDRSRLIPVG